MESIACMLAAAHCTVCPFAYSEAQERAGLYWHESGASMELDADCDEFVSDMTEVFFADELLAHPRVLGSWDAVYVYPCPAEASMRSLLSPVSEDESDGIPF